MSSRRTNSRRPGHLAQGATLPALLGMAVLAATLPPSLHAQRAAAGRTARLSEETLVPTEVFPADDGKRFGYPNGFEVVYTRTDVGHNWKLTERSIMMAAPTPEMSPEAAPGASPTPSPTPEAPSVLPATPEEPDFLASVGFVRPTFVTIAFLDSPASATERVETFNQARSDETARPANLAVMQLERDPKLSPGAVLYGREFNLGPKTGGMRRGFSIVLAKGSTYLQVDTYWGLKDGAYEAELDTLEKRARAVAAFVLKKL